MEPGQAPNSPFNQQSGDPTPLPTPGQSITPTPTPYQAVPEQPSTAAPQPASPMAQQAAPQLFPSNPVVGQQPNSAVPMVPASSPKKGKNLVIAVVVVVLVAAGAVGVLLLLNKKKPQSSTGSTGTTQSYASGENTALTALQHDGGSLSASSLASINATDLFYSVFRNASEQPTVTTTTNFYWTPQVNGTPIKSSSSDATLVTQAGYNYKNAQFTFQANLDGDLERCVNGVEYDASTDGSLPWTKDELSIDCQIANTTATINDGLNTGGLSAAQGQKFVDAIRNIKGLLTVTKSGLVTEQGAPYIRLDVSVDAKTDCYPNSVPSGIGCFGTAFRGLNLPESWPYVTQASIASGAKLAYFVSPKTQLPAYMQVAFTPVTASEGNWSNQQIEYNFGQLPAIQVADGDLNALALSWPVIQL